jgi:hypothetical protein
MRLMTVRENAPLGTEFHLYPLGDVHYGSANCDTDAFDGAVSTIDHDPLARWIGMGDYIEAIAPRDKRWSAGGIDQSVIPLSAQDRIGDVYVEKMSDKLAPIIDKCWAMGEGNHERVFNGMFYTNLCVRILEKLGRPDIYSGWAAMTRAVFEDSANHRCSLRLFHSHGWQAGRMEGAKVNQLDYIMGWIEDCHIYLQGHSHSRLVKTKTKLGTNPSFTKLVAYDAYGAHTGSFLRTYEQDTEGYGECAGYPPVPIGMLRFNITTGTDGVNVESVQ